MTHHGARQLPLYDREVTAEVRLQVRALPPRQVEMVPPPPPPLVAPRQAEVRMPVMPVVSHVTPPSWADAPS